MSACVPTASAASPEASAASVSRLAFAPMEPVSLTTFSPKGARKPLSVAKCCSASSSVGAMNALCSPLPAASQMSAAATRVLPEPTSPCISRFISLPEVMSPAASAMARSCAPVGVKGSVAVNSAMSRGCTAMPGCTSPSPRTSESAQTSVNNSSNTSLLRESESARMSAGKWMFS